MKRKPASLIFSIQLSVFLLIARSKLNFMKRDIDEFIKYGKTPEKIEAVEKIADEYMEIPNDDDLLGKQIITTEKKDKEAEKLRGILGGIMNRAQNTFGENTGEYRRFGVTSISDLDGMELYFSGFYAHRIATEYLTEMTPQGLTPAILTEFDTSNKSYLKALAEQLDALSNRDLATERRINKANQLYTEIVNLCATGKRIWGSVNEAKYNDYLIYDTPSGKKDDEVKPA